MSTQHAVTGADEPAPHAALAALLLAWEAAIVAAGLLAWYAGARAEAVAGAGALAIAPALTGLALLPRLGEKPAQLALLTAWLIAAAALTAGAGGASSPLVAGLAAAPALCAALRSPHVAEAGAAALVAYVGAAAGSEFLAPAQGLGLMPQFIGAVAIAFVSALTAIAFGHARSARAPSVSAELAHELRTPLTHIIGFAEMLEQQVHGQIGAKNVEYAGFIRQSGTQLLDMADDMLDAARLEAGRFRLRRERFDAREVIEMSARVFAEAARAKGVELSTSLPDALMVDADRRALRRMLANTIGNAVKFTPEGGRVRVEARREGAMLVLDTIDSGPGISAAERTRLGRAFARGAAGESAEGSGLGLWLTGELARAHGGTLSFHEGPGGGALVRIAAPILIEPEES